MKSNNKIGIADRAPDFWLTGTDGHVHGLGEIKTKAILVVFMCNHCPYVIPKIKSLISIQNDFKENLTVVGINPNSGNANYVDDSFDNMKKTVEKFGINFLYLNDDTQEIARLYGATCTPDPFLFKNNKLFYHGQIDDGHGPDAIVVSEDLRKAIKCAIADQEIDFDFKPSMGCSIKWVD